MHKLHVKYRYSEVLFDVVVAIDWCFLDTLYFDQPSLSWAITTLSTPQHGIPMHPFIPHALTSPYMHSSPCGSLRAYLIPQKHAQ